MDTTSYGLSVLLSRYAIDMSIANSAADDIVKNTDRDGIVKVYLGTEKVDSPLDHVAAANVLYFTNQLGRGEEVKPTEEWLVEVLNSGALLKGSRYYHSPDAFLYFLSRSLKYPRLREKFAPKLRKYLDERIGSTEYPLDLAMRISTSNELGIKSPERKLLLDQQNDGAWPADSIYHYGSKEGYFGSKVISTAFAVEALSRPTDELDREWESQRTMWNRGPEGKAMVVGFCLAMGISIPLLVAKHLIDGVGEVIRSVKDQILKP